MSVATETDRPDGPDDSPGGSPDPAGCSNAREYIRRRLAEIDGTAQPSELADEYDCSSGHIRRELRELAEAGEVTRVSRGQYKATESGNESSGEQRGDGTDESGEQRDVRPDLSEPGSDDSADDDADGASERERTVTLPWMPDDDGERGVPEAVEANGRMIQALNESVETESIEEDVAAALEMMKERLNEHSDHIRALLTVSDIEGSGVCPECEGHLERVSNLLDSDRIECADCGTVAARLEG